MTQNPRTDRECPYCDSSLLAEWCLTLRAYYCPCCGTSWRPRPSLPGEGSRRPLPPTPGGTDGR
jgi:hypothetical protein